MFLFALIANAAYVGRLFILTLLSQNINYVNVLQSVSCLAFMIYRIFYAYKKSNTFNCLCSILVRTTEWESIKANMPWLLDAIGCVALDLFVSFIRIFYSNFNLLLFCLNYYTLMMKRFFCAKIEKP